MADYTLFYTSQDFHHGRGAAASTWSVYSERYRSISDAEPIEGSTRWIMRCPTEIEADRQARRLQRESSTHVRCAVCSEPVSYDPHPDAECWYHPHSADIYCGTGDGATARPSNNRHAVSRNR